MNIYKKRNVSRETFDKYRAVCRDGLLRMFHVKHFMLVSCRLFTYNRKYTIDLQKGGSSMDKHKHRLSVLGILFTMALGLIHIINKIIIASISSKDALPESYDHYHWKFGRIFYTKQGSGKPLLLIHDLQAGSSSYEWNKVVSVLSKKYEVYTLDLLGCGHSDKPKITYTNYLYVQLLCDFTKNVIGKKTDVIASGYSGSFSVMACRNAENIFDKILLVNPPDFRELNEIPTKNSLAQKFMLEIPIIGTMIYNIFMCRQNIDHIFAEKLFFNPFRVDPKFQDSYYENAHADDCGSKYLYASRIGKYTNINIISCIRETDHSIYIIEGDYETDGKEILKAYTNHNPSIESVYVQHAKHFPHLENAEEFLKQVDVFLD